MLLDYKLGQTSVVIRVKLRDSSVSTGAGLTGLTSGSTGLRIATIADSEATSTAYTAAGSTIEAVTALGTYAAPTTNKCRFKEVDATNHPGIYEIQLDNARLAVAGAKSLMVSIGGATNLAQCDVVIPLRTVDPYNANFGLTNLDAAVSTRSTYAGADTSGTTTLLSRLTGTRATNLDNLDAPVSTRSTYAGADTSGTTTLLSRLTSTRAGYLDNIATAPPSASTIAAAVDAGLTRTGFYLAAGGLDAIQVETGVNARQALSPILSAAAGVLSGADTGTVVIKGGNVAVTRITATTDAFGNRTAVTLNLPS